MIVNETDQGPPGHDEGRPGKSGPTTSNLNLTSTMVQQAVPPIPTVESYLAGLGPVPRSTSCASCDFGVVFEDGRRRCDRHWTAADRDLIAELNRRGRAVGLPIDRRHRLEGQRAFPYGPRAYVAMRREMLEWAEANQLRYADRSHACEAWLRAERCPGVDRCAGLGRAILRRGDHASSWTGPAGLRLIVAQPYALSSQDADELRELADVDGLHVTVQPPGALWYGEQTYAVLLAAFPDTTETAA
ncbi:hypothetical protein [Nocardioides okcheonensis]|uniref:hypothetical protein n=1 Tax=Nocardioides okcheonensis TaxID=2894081 RepID=UPI001E2854A0|nr:hypothetical protein [Nocardioides okcheonensis]UFN44520.1 hypothetical protein LN652_21165 [Nocardioides okcheonensis]